MKLCERVLHLSTVGGLCKYRASRPSQGTVNGVPSLNDLAVDGMLNTTNLQTNI